jgi:hypothetical protein
MNLVNPYWFSARDPFYANVSLLLHCDGTNGSTSFPDNSPSPKTVTALGNAQVTTSNSKFGTGAMLLDGLGDYVTTPSNSSYNFGTGNFTIEFWIRYTSISGYQVIMERGWVSAGGLIIQTNINNGRILFYLSGALVAQEPSLAANTNQWYFYAFTRTGTTVRIFRDGVQTATGTSSTNITSTSLLSIGAYAATTLYSVNGRLDDIRITNGVSRYSADFTPPTAPFPDS